MTLSMRVEYDKYWRDVSMMNIFLYVSAVLDPQYKIDSMVYGLGLAHGKALAKHIAARVRETLCRLFDEFVMVWGGNITAPTHTALPPPEVKMEKRHRLE